MSEMHHFLFDVTHQDTGHTHLTIRCGPKNNSRAKAGDLILKTPEWNALAARLGVADHGESRCQSPAWDRLTLEVVYRERGGLTAAEQREATDG